MMKIIRRACTKIVGGKHLSKKKYFEKCQNKNVGLTEGQQSIVKQETVTILKIVCTVLVYLKMIYYGI